MPQIVTGTLAARRAFSNRTGNGQGDRLNERQGASETINSYARSSLTIIIEINYYGIRVFQNILRALSSAGSTV